MKTQLPRTAKVELSGDAKGHMTKLVIDGVDQGALDESCRTSADFTNLSGAPQTAKFSAPL
jgi:hypothetical protein